MRKTITTIILILLFGSFGVANAQLSGSLPQTDINVDMVPEIPKPNETVYVSLTSYATNINSANITWSVNDEIKQSGMGQKSFTFSVGAMNTTTTLNITIETQEGEVVEKTLRIKPAGVDLIWESEGFVPPFYKGKSLFSHQNKVTLVALPHITSSNGSEINAKNLIYTWKKNGSVIESASGFGKNTYSFVSSLISRPFSISVDVTTTDETGIGYTGINVTPTEPSVVFYRKDPIYGIEFQKALYGTTELVDSKELTVVGMPLFFGTTNQTSSGLIYKWSVNGSPTNNGPQQFVQVFRQLEGTSGTANISLSVENTIKILQYGSSNFNLMFGANSSQ